MQYVANGTELESETKSVVGNGKEEGRGETTSFVMVTEITA